MAKWIVDNAFKTQMESLDDATVRRIRRQMVENGAKVLIKEIQGVIESHHHVVSGAMKESVKVGRVYEDVDGTYIDVYPQEYDRRGVSNEMKAQIINYGYYHVASGKRQKKTDFFLNDAFRKKCEPRILAVMNETFSICMDEINKQGG